MSWGERRGPAVSTGTTGQAETAVAALASVGVEGLTLAEVALRAAAKIEEARDLARQLYTVAERTTPDRHDRSWAAEVMRQSIDTIHGWPDVTVRRLTEHPDGGS